MYKHGRYGIYSELINHCLYVIIHLSSLVSDEDMLISYASRLTKKVEVGRQ